MLSLISAIVIKSANKNDKESTPIVGYLLEVKSGDRIVFAPAEAYDLVNIHNSVNCIAKNRTENGIIIKYLKPIDAKVSDYISTISELSKDVLYTRGFANSLSEQYGIKINIV